MASLKKLVSKYHFNEGEICIDRYTSVVIEETERNNYEHLIHTLDLYFCEKMELRFEPFIYKSLRNFYFYIKKKERKKGII